MHGVVNCYEDTFGTEIRRTRLHVRPKMTPSFAREECQVGQASESYESNANRVPEMTNASSAFSMNGTGSDEGGKLG